MQKHFGGKILQLAFLVGQPQEIVVHSLSEDALHLIATRFVFFEILQGAQFLFRGVVWAVTDFPHV